MRELRDFLQAKFDYLVDSYDETDTISVENVNFEMRKYWLSFLKAGFDACQVVKMMSVGQVWRHYDVLNSYGANIDASQFVTKFHRDFVISHWDEFIERGVSADALAERCYGNPSSPYMSDEELKAILGGGVSVKTAFKLVGATLEFNDDRPENLIDIFSILREYGLPAETMDWWLKSHLHSTYLVRDIVEDNPNAWEELGINVSDYVDEWIKDNADDYLYGCDDFKNLPAGITIQRLIDSEPMATILSLSEDYGFLSFIEKYVHAGEKVDTLARKFLDEIGYSSEREHLDAMLDLVVSGATVIDIERFIDCIKACQMDEESIGFFYSDLKDVGIDETFLAKIS